MKKELSTRCEMALMGFTQPVTKEELKDVIPYIASAMGIKCDTQEVIDTLFKYCGKLTPKHFVLNTIMGDMKCLTVTLDDGETPYVIDSEFGVLSTVYNFTYPDCSEMGYSFFENNHGTYRRIA